MSRRKLEAVSMRTWRTIEDVTEFWHERAAIREYDGGASRADAEAGALLDVAGIASARPR